MPPSPCAQCGTLIPQGSRFCPQCGASLGGSTPLAEVPTDGPWEAILVRLREAALPRYRVRKLLGSGGMAGVYLAEEPRLGRRVAIKVMSPGLMADPAQVDRFHQEARATARLSHPNIVTIHEIDDRGGLHYFVMAYVEGRTLGDVLSDAQGPLPIPVVLRWFRQVAGALHHAHRLGIVHRDVKPGNILLDGDGNALVTDFGIAKVADEPGLTRTGMLVGTPTYMSPEQCLSTEITGAADQYSLGVLVYHMLTGAPPFTGGTMAVLQAHVGQRAEPLLSRRPECPVELATLVDRMMAKDPADRWPSLVEVLEILEESGTSTAISSGVLPGVGRPPASPISPPASPISPAPSGSSPAPPPVSPGPTPQAAPPPRREVKPDSDRKVETHPRRAPDPVAVPGGLPLPAPAPSRPPPGSSPSRRWVGGLVGVVTLGVVGFLLLRGGSNGGAPGPGPTVATAPLPTPRPGGDPRLDGMGPEAPPGAALDQANPQGREAPSQSGPNGITPAAASPGSGGLQDGTSGPRAPEPSASGGGTTTSPPPPDAPARVAVAGNLPPGTRLTAVGPGGTQAMSPGGTNLPAGRWTLEFQAPGHRSQREVVTLQAGARFTWSPSVVAESAPPAPAVAGATPPEPAPAAAAFDEAAARAGVEGALAAFAGGFQSRDMQNVVRRYPTSSEEWRSEWRPLVEDTRNVRDLQAGIGEVRHLAVAEGSADVQFVMTLRYVDLRNRSQSQELRFRGRLVPGADGPGGSGWMLVDLQTGG